MKAVDKGLDIHVAQKQDITQMRDFFNRSTMDPRHQEDDTNIIYNTVTMKDMLLTPCYQDFMVAFASTEGIVALIENQLLIQIHLCFSKQKLFFYITRSCINNELLSAVTYVKIYVTAQPL